MRKLKIFVNNIPAGVFAEVNKNEYIFSYFPDYSGLPISLTMPVSTQEYSFKEFPPFFDGLLPEGLQLEGLLRQCKIDRYDLFAQLAAVGHDLVGAVTVKEII